MTTGERRSAPGDWANEPELADVRRWLDEGLAAGRPTAIVLLGLARLDLLNAAHGREAGDAVMRTAEMRLLALAERVERLGGGRFLLTTGADKPAALRLASTAAEALAQPYPDGMVVGSRAALALGGPGESAAALLARAGEALEEAHAAAPGVPTVAERGQAMSLDALAVDLHHAIARGEIALLFQPQVRVADGAITGAEALARWRHPRLGELGAQELFAAAAWADLELPLSEHIQGRALAETAAWPAALAELRVSVNVTAGDVLRPGFADALLGRIARSGLSPDRVTAELTEVGPVADLPTAAAALAQLRDAGCGVAIDDFGAGYSSLAYLRALPVDTVKLDRSLIEGIVAGSADARLVEGAIAMIGALGLSVVAEGVEDEAQLAVLAKAGCDRYQGFLCAPPLDGAGLVKLVEDRACAR